MLTINYNWKNYRWIGDKWGIRSLSDINWGIYYEWTSTWVYFVEQIANSDRTIRTYHTPEQLVKLGYMEEVEEKPEEKYYQCGFPDDTSILTELKDPSILEKLRYEIDKLTIYCRSIHSADCSRGETEKEKNTHMIELSQVLDLLTSLETKEETTEKDPWEEASALCTHIVKTSDPLHCLKCWEVLSEKAETQFTPWQEESLIKNTIHNNCSGGIWECPYVVQWPHEPCTWNMSNEEATEAIRKSDEYNEKHFPWYKEFKEKNQKEYDELFKPIQWQEIEVSNDGEKWEKRKFVENVPPNHDYLCEEYAFATRTWQFARPIEDKIDHDQVKENIRVMDEQDGKIEPQLPEVPPIDFDQYMTWLEMAQKHQEVPYTVISILLAQAVAVNKFCQTLSRQKTTK